MLNFKTWVVQRVSGVVIALYLLTLAGFWAMDLSASFADWQDFMRTVVMRFASFACLLSLITHTWLGLYTICGDYLRNSKVRIVVQTLIIFSLVYYLCFGAWIIWH